MLKIIYTRYLHNNLKHVKKYFKKDGEILSDTLDDVSTLGGSRIIIDDKELSKINLNTLTA